MWDTFIEVVKPYLNAILIGFGGFILAFVVSQLVGRALAKPMGKGWSRFLGNLVGLAVVIWTLKLILESAGAAGFVVVIVTAITGAFALGSERVASDLVAGVSLFFSRIYKPDDYVSIAGYEGKVIATSLSLTTLEGIDGDLIYIRNTDVTSGTIINYSVQPGHLVNVQLILPANQDLSLAVSAIEKAIAGFSPELEKTKESYRPKVVLESAEYGYVNVQVRAYVPEVLDYGNEKTRLYLLAHNAMRNAGLDLLAAE
jgi:small conductance mechanosensitive channel